MPTCINCTTKESSQFFLLPAGDYMCRKCFTNEDVKEAPKSHLPLFVKWICKTHNCGSYNISNLSRHEMPWCDITKETTVGVVKPKTFGGYNGNVGRHYFQDWTDHVRRNDNELHAIKVWKRFTKRIPGKDKVHHAGNKYNKRVKNANRPREILQFA